MIPAARRVIRFAVISDIHADSPAVPHEDKDTYVHVEPPMSMTRRHPIRDLLAFIEDEKISVDWVLAPGDVANRASEKGRPYAWSQLHQIKDALSARGLTASPGNHDVVTREAVVDPAAHLKTLVPSFPSGDPGQDAAFWADGYSIDDSHPDFRILNINSCFSFPQHPGSSATPQEIEEHRSSVNRGTFSEAQQQAIENVIKTLTYKPANIAILHHHPVEHENVELFKDWYGPMHRGSELVHMLENANCGRWVIVHGHKHVPLISRSGLSNQGPIILCSASLGGKLWHPIVTVTRNQFHIMEFEVEPHAGLPGTRGTIHSYMWGFGSGWAPAQPMSGLPAVAGFGMTVDHTVLAESSIEALDRTGREFMPWSELESRVPGVRYQAPRDFELYEAELHNRGYSVEYHRGRYVNLSRKR